MSVEAFPLQWPPAWKRTPSSQRLRARFYRLVKKPWQTGGTYDAKEPTTLAQGMKEVSLELERMGVANVVVSTNVELRRDGLPYSGRRDPDDPGVAVYFLLDGHRQLCIPCDKWDRVADNLIAVARTVEALRGIERWGAKSMVDAAFSGFKALPERAGSPHWCDVLGLGRDATEDEIRDRYRCEAMARHPYRGGTHEAFVELQAAFREALAERSVGVKCD